jgi:AraC-like DNA-binding protein
VKAALEEMGLHYGLIALGEANIKEDMTSAQREQLRTVLLISGLELMDDKKSLLVEKVKHLVIEMIHYADGLPPIKNSVYISQKLNYDYTYLANLFSEVTGVTIEQYIITHKIERVKELLVYGELTLSQIANSLNYSSVAHLSNQFKKVTGLTPTYFRKLKGRKPKQR